MIPAAYDDNHLFSGSIGVATDRTCRTSDRFIRRIVDSSRPIILGIDSAQAELASRAAFSDLLHAPTAPRSPC